LSERGVSGACRSRKIGARIRRLRLGLGYTRPLFADAIGAASSALHAWENDEVEPSEFFLIAIARVFAVDVDWLTHGEGRPYPHYERRTTCSLCPRCSYLRDERVPFNSKVRRKTRRFVAGLTPSQRRRALVFYTDLVAALAEASEQSAAANHSVNRLGPGRTSMNAVTAFETGTAHKIQREGTDRR
jgi:transcriptional regulator with XRE-family HTH domain